tara:strand:+ start:10551 stop:10742 length:192 start_codon:yes stop_codon:yes gene_type:complete
MNWHNRYIAMKKELGLTNSDISEITGNTPDSIRTVTQKNKELPRWIKLSIYVYEKYNQSNKTK